MCVVLIVLWKRRKGSLNPQCTSPKSPPASPCARFLPTMLYSGLQWKKGRSKVSISTVVNHKRRQLLPTILMATAMNFRFRDTRGSRSLLLDDIEDGGIRPSSSYSSHEINEHENDRAMDGLQDRVLMLKKLTGDIHEEVEGHNRMLDRMGNDMDSSRGVLSGTMDKFKMVFQTKSSRKMFTYVASFVVIFLIIYYLTSGEEEGVDRHTLTNNGEHRRRGGAEDPSMTRRSRRSVDDAVEQTAMEFQPGHLTSEELEQLSLVKGGGGGEEREIQKNYWVEHSVDLTVEAMMLDSMAADLDKEERPEVLSLLPDYEGKNVLELGAGIGRFTGELAKKAGKVIALDFIESVVKKNESINGHLGNVEFMCADVTSSDLNFPAESMDLVFSNWLLMYLSDTEVEYVAERLLKWVKVGGYIFFRESCFHQSGDHKRKNNPTHYREPRFYTKVFKECHTSDVSGNSYELSLVGSKCIGAYVRSKKNQNQICWIWKKVVNTENDRGFQQFLDNIQYKNSGILRYERIFGPGFVSTGGLDTTKEFVAMLDLKPGQKVLDVGCGIGGGDFYMAETFDVDVVGIDLSVNMISFALERAIGLKCSVDFEVADCTKKSYPDNTFDVIYSRDTILHIQDKPALFRTFYKWLKPGGKVLISDYCRKSGTPSEDFAEYIKQRGYDLHDVETYGQMLRDAGFGEVTAEDRTEQFKEVLRRELERVEKGKEEFIHDFTEDDYNDIVGGWKAKLVRTGSGEQRWGLFVAKKK
ncbi:hypothetical protein SSX86_011679 [Deinandra increscens subsp. villosa]|uniref:phosphoethanolamine N-methyltransferase n=1 Tax=Deinandra increscens subsp. villosa TaxID=3103831 RepID=A0AAP0DAD0_9ASTR